jgi:hypothetical protein
MYRLAAASGVDRLTRVRPDVFSEALKISNIVTTSRSL